MASPTVHVTVDGKRISVPRDATLAHVVEVVGVDYPNLVVRVDGKPLPGKDWKSVSVREGMVVEIVPVVTGG